MPRGSWFAETSHVRDDRATRIPGQVRHHEDRPSGMHPVGASKTEPAAPLRFANPAVSAGPENACQSACKYYTPKQQNNCLDAPGNTQVMKYRPQSVDLLKGLASHGWTQMQLVSVLLFASTGTVVMSPFHRMALSKWTQEA